MNRNIFRRVMIRWSVEAPTKMKHSFTSSEGWKETPPM